MPNDQTENESLVTSPPASTETPATTEEQTSSQPNPEETKTEEEKPEVKTEEFTPLSVEDLQMPEGLTADEGLQKEFLDVLNNRELSPKEQANALLALQGKALGAASDASHTAWAETQKTWQDEVRNDPDIGGAKLEPILGNINKLVQELGTPELPEVFALTGAGNNVHIVKFLAKIADQLNEGSPVSGKPSGGETDRAALLYPTMRN